MQEINQKAVNDLSKLLKENDLAEIEYETEEFYIKVVSSKPQSVSEREPQTVIVPEVVHPVMIENQGVKEQTINSPMVGVVYLSADPNKENFVKVGDEVSVGQTLCLVEAMKTFNPIKAHIPGKIKKILVETGDMIEFDQPLFVVE